MRVLNRLYRRYQFLRHKPWHWELRPGTIDRRLFGDVVIRNEYRLPNRFADNDVIVDVGGHTGAFAYTALRRGAGRVYCCEADPGNFRILERNLYGFGPRVTLLNRAVWRSDVETTTLPFANQADERNTGAGAVAEDGEPVSAMPFDALIDLASASGRRRIRLVKLDCEGAEWPILLTSKCLGHIDAISGEYHLGPFPDCYRIPGVEAFSTKLLDRHLAANGFQVHRQATVLAPRQTMLTELGLFFAERNAT